MNCFEDGKNPVHYSLNRSTDSTKILHIKNQHKHVKKKGKPRFASPKEVSSKDALEFWKRWHGKEDKASKPQGCTGNVRVLTVFTTNKTSKLCLFQMQ